MNVDLGNLKSLSLSGKSVKSLYINSKRVRLGYTISFNTNMASGGYYYIAGQGGAATAVTVSDVYVAPGASIDTLPSVGSASSGYAYTLSGYTYYIYVVGWYLEPTMTTQVTASWVPAGDTTLYAKWKMTANVGIAASITVPMFATSVSWTCYSNGGGRVAVSKSYTTNHYVGIAMAAPGANRNGDSYTWTGAVQGKALTLGTMICSLNGVSRSVANGANGATTTGTYYVANTGTLVGTASTLPAVSTTVFNTNNLKCIVTAPQLKTSGSRSFTATFYYANASKGSYVIAKQNVNKTTDHGDIDWKVSSVGAMSTRSTTYSSGHYGAAGAYGVTKWSSGTVSLAAASGTGYSRTVTVNA